MWDHGKIFNPYFEQSSITRYRLCSTCTKPSIFDKIALAYFCKYIVVVHASTL